MSKVVPPSELSWAYCLAPGLPSLSNYSESDICQIVSSANIGTDKFQILLTGYWDLKSSNRQSHKTSQT